jgi:regulator of protease activity HflC (stomatin/prohibitin superfamily)
MLEQIKSSFSLKKLTIGLIIAIGVIGLVLLPSIFETVDNSEIVIVQSITGKTTIYKEPGPILQMFGKVTHYKKSNQFWFSKNETDETATPIEIMFNDNGVAKISGSVRYYLPNDDKSILDFHTTFRSMEAIENQLIKQTVSNAIYMTGPLMSSKESSSEKRPDLLRYISDQCSNGVYKTEKIEQTVHDDLLNTDKAVTVVRIKEKNGILERQSDSELKKFGISLQGFAINRVEYDPAVQAQIKKQQEATMAVQMAIANSKKAEQQAITVELEGKANAAEAKWEQEVIKAKVITEAQQQKEVAKLAAETAELDARKVKTDADAKAYANAKLVSAGLTPQERAEFEKSTKIGVAAELAKIHLPTTYISGSNGGNGNGLLESLLGVKLLEK